MAQLLHCFCSGGASLADAQRFNDEPLVLQLARVEKFADQTQLGEWLRQPNDASIAALWQLLSQFIAWVIERADPARWTYAGRSAPPPPCPPAPGATPSKPPGAMAWQ